MTRGNRGPDRRPDGWGDRGDGRWAERPGRRPAAAAPHRPGAQPRAHARRHWPRLLAALWACAIAWPAAAQGHAEPAAPPAGLAATTAPSLPSPLQMQQAWQQSPLYRSARANLAAERAAARQGATAADAWTLNGSLLQRWQADPAGRGQEWEFAAERPWRRAERRAVTERLGQLRIDSARAALQRGFQAWAGPVLEAWLGWQRAEAAWAVHRQMAAIARRQTEAVVRRVQLGDAARLEQTQAEAAALQAETQLEAARARALWTREALAQRLAGQDAAATPSEPPALPAGLLTPWAPEHAAEQAAWLQQHPQLAELREAAAVLRAQADEQRADERPDPTVGVRVGTLRQGAERLVGLSLSLPLGGESRRAATQAAAARALAAEQQAQALALALQQQQQQRLAEGRLAERLASQQSAAAERQQAVADALARGLALGEGSLAELLAARRQVLEQRLAAAQARLDALAAALTLAHEAGRLWPCAEACQAPD